MLKETNDIFIDSVYAGSSKDMNLDKMLQKTVPGNDWKQVMSSNGGFSGYRIYFNESEMRARVISWKTNSGFKDKDDNYLYYGDVVEDDKGLKGTIERHSEGFDFKTGLYNNVYYEFVPNYIKNLYNPKMKLTDDFAKKLKKISNHKVISF